ncbi:YciI family protein [Microbacterium rhizophilus]|uniref:YciI family protein n=1 Tax=Microbacterium rhizophilus TaxID=3138934 RepID=UPI0031EE7385
MTQYAILLPGDEGAWERASDEERAAVYALHGDFARALAERGHRITGGAELELSHGAKTVRRGPTGEVLITDGPYAEAAEQLTGFYLVEFDDLDDLLQICGILAHGENIEVRAVVEREGQEP